MVKHMVAWKLKPEARATKEIADANYAHQIERMESMKAAVPQLLSYEIYRSFNIGDNFFDFVIIMNFNSREDLEIFEHSNAHMDPEARKFMKSIREAKAVVDYEI